MADLTPTPDRPGLHVSKPSPSAPATASAVCHCGARATATGDAQVKALVDGWDANHGRAHGRK
ncbi:hypothetical protein AQI88_18860 [Streptomyces cellostaticus]|uniref:Uncharacterized protein n=1 Tax=Streptomyces cellostaticus TaxID=67285 RepID=A0A101NKN6_9ACTN|nr:hypothetical protein [Streptomyces cellostaticus]KUM94905.1 hypothetical protein AQI88_18860 [Streptomyces cellostaticus]GHI06408.1 hypothetical protein Scel_47290 [Streptomyces cellostaticus]